MDVKVRLPAPIGIPLATKPATEPTLRDVVKILKGTWDPQGNLWLKILCRVTQRAEHSRLIKCHLWERMLKP